MIPSCRIAPGVAVLATLALFALASCADDAAPEVEVPSWAKVAPEQIAEAKKHGVPVAFENDLGMRFVLIPAGTFLMGSPEDEEGRYDDETQHEVTITKPFYMQIMEVTEVQFQRWKPGYDRWFPGSEMKLDAREYGLPVSVVWEDADGFAEWLTQDVDGDRAYRLPTEAEWEYTCRAATTTAFAFGKTMALRQGNILGVHLGPNREWPEVDDVGSYEPNDWGIHDMHGNQHEWCADWYAPYPATHVTDPRGPVHLDAPRIQTLVLGDGSLPEWRLARARVVRGGCHVSDMRDLRSARRTAAHPGPETETAPGFRLVSPLPEPGERGR